MCQDTKRWTIYSDGSVTGKKTSSVSLIFKDGKYFKRNIDITLKRKTSTYSELFAIYKALKSINRNIRKHHTIVIHTDADAIAKAINGKLRDNAKVLKQHKELWNFIFDMRERFNIEATHLKAHTGTHNPQHTCHVLAKISIKCFMDL